MIMAKRAGRKPIESEDALIAVEEALKIDFSSEADADALEDPYAATPDNELAASNSRQRSTRTGITPSAPAANDDRRSGAARFSASFAREPSSAMIWFSLVLSILWVCVAAWAGYKIVGAEVTRLSAWINIADNPTLIYFLASLLLPLLLIWGYAFMIRRAQEMRLAARSMTEVAYRLIEPETETTNSVRSVGQAIRVEVNALTDGIERAIARASELETLVHGEVSSLENSYSDNELRMRSLVQELASERDAIVNHTERVRSSISGASETLQDDLKLSAQQISANVALAQEQFSNALDNTSDNLLQEVTRKGMEIGQQIQGSGDSLIGKLENTREKTSKTFEDMEASLMLASDTLASSVVEKGFELGTQIELAGSGLVSQLDQAGSVTVSSIEEVKATLEFASESLSEFLSSKGSQIANRIEASGTGLIEKITATGSSTSNALEIKTNELADRINFLSSDMQQKVGEQFSSIDATLKTSGNALVNMLGQRTSELGNIIDGKSKIIDKTMAEQITGFWTDPFRSH